jgi:ferredoxin
MGLAMTEVLRINPLRCDAQGLCAELFPEWISYDDWGYPIVRRDAIPPHLREHACRAVSSCPRVALALVEQP